MAVLRVGYSDGSCVPSGSGTVRHSRMNIGGLRERHTVAVEPASGYDFIRWELDIPELGPDEQFDGGSLSSIQAQLSSSTIVWDDPEEWDGGMGISFIAHMEHQEEATGEILYGSSGVPIYGQNGSLLFKG